MADWNSSEGKTEKNFLGARRDRFSDTDAEPGSTENSKEYDRLYNPQGENEYTNQPENANQLEEIHQLRRRNEYIRGLRSEFSNALKRVQFWPNVGRFVIPKENTFAAHLTLVREGNTVDIQFNPKKYNYFDKIIATQSGKPELFNPSHPDYKKYDNLRDNLAVLRNDIMGEYMNDGSFDPNDTKYLPKLVEMANEIGLALRVGNTPGKVLFESLDKDLLNIPGEGAAHIYKFLLEHQASNGLVGNLKAIARRMFGQPDRQWDLPPIDETPFGMHGLMAPAKRDELCQCSHRDLESRTAEIGAEISAHPQATKEDVDSITIAEKREAVNHGHTILEWLRNIQFSNKSLQDFVDTGNPSQTAPERDAMNMLIDAYYDIAEAAFKQQPDLFNHPKVKAANEALESLEHALGLMAILEKPKSLADTMQISSDETQQPEKWHEMCGHTVDRLMNTLKGGLEEAVSTMEAQQQDMEQQQEENADRQVEALANHASFAKGRKKRKQRASGGGAAKQKKIDQAIKADDYALAQGIHADRKETGRGTLGDAPKPTPASRATAARSTSADPMVEAQIQAGRAKLQGADVGAQPPSQPMPIDSALVKQLGKAMLQMQKDSDAAAASLPTDAVRAVQEQTSSQRVEGSRNNSKRPGIG